MAAYTFTIFAANKRYINIDALINADIKMALIGGDSLVDDTTSGVTVWADLSSREIANGNGYTTGGKTLTNLQCGLSETYAYFKTDDVTWDATGGQIPQWYIAVMYVDGTLWGQTNPVIGYFIGNLVDSTPEPVPATPMGEQLALLCPLEGWFTTS